MNKQGSAEQKTEDLKDIVARQLGYYDYNDALRDFYIRDAVHEAIHFMSKVNEQQCSALKEEIDARVNSVHDLYADEHTKMEQEIAALKEEYERLKAERDFYKDRFELREGVRQKNKELESENERLKAGLQKQFDENSANAGALLLAKQEIERLAAELKAASEKADNSYNQAIDDALELYYNPNDDSDQDTFDTDLEKLKK